MTELEFDEITSWSELRDVAEDYAFDPMPEEVDYSYVKERICEWVTDGFLSFGELGNLISSVPDCDYYVYDPEEDMFVDADDDSFFGNIKNTIKRAILNGDGFDVEDEDEDEDERGPDPDEFTTCEQSELCFLFSAAS